MQFRNVLSIFVTPFGIIILLASTIESQSSKVWYILVTLLGIIIFSKYKESQLKKVPDIFVTPLGNSEILVKFTQSENAKLIFVTLLGIDGALVRL